MGGRGASSGGAGGGGSKSLNLLDPRVQNSNLTDEEYNALRRYTKSSNINKLLGVNGYDNLDDYDKNYVKTLDKGIAKAGFNQDYYPDPQHGKPMFLRGGGGRMVGVPKEMNFGSPQELADYINTNLIGKTTTNAGYTSITTTKSVAKDFASYGTNPIILEYQKIGKGTRGTYVSGGHGVKAISSYGSGEDETLLQRNVKTTPLRAYVGSDGFVHVEVHAKG